MNHGHAIDRAPFLIDCFRGPVLRKASDSTILVLTHAHSDHYGGLDERWDRGLVHCSPSTARFVRDVLGVASRFVVALELLTVHEFGGFQLVLLDAGHCPGSCMVLVRRPDGTLALHTGDCRFVAESMGAELEQAVHLLDRGRTLGDDTSSFIDDLYLDTTYAGGDYTFSPQEAAIDFLARRVARLLAEDAERSDGRRTLVLIGTYLVGKEKLIARLAHEHKNMRILCTERRHAAIFSLLGLPAGHDDEVQACGGRGRQHELLRQLRDNLRGGAAITSSQGEEPPPNVVVVPISEIGLFAPGNWKFMVDWPVLRDRLGHEDSCYRLEAFVPTGWAFKLEKYAPAGDDGRASDPEAFPHTVLRLETDEPIRTTCFAYSEHSSFDQLRKLVALARPSSLTPIVVSHPSSAKATQKRDAAVAKIVGKFADLMNRQQRRVDAFARLFGKKAASAGSQRKESGGAVEDALVPPAASPPKQRPSPVKRTRPAKMTTKDGKAIEPPTAIHNFFQRSPSPRKRPRDDSAADHTQLKMQLDALVGAGILPDSVTLADILPLVASLPPGVEPSGDFIASSYFESPLALPAAATARPDTAASVASVSSGPTDPPSAVTSKLIQLPTPAAGGPPRSLSAPFSLLAKLCAKMEDEKGRLKLRDMMCRALHRLAVEYPSDLLFAVRFLSGELEDPHHPSSELGVGYRIIGNAVKEALNISDKALRAASRKHGDLGLAAQEARQSRRLLFSPAPLTIDGVAKAFRRIAAAGGKGGVQAKTAILKKLLVAAQGVEVCYLIRYASVGASFTL